MKFTEVKGKKIKFDIHAQKSNPEAFTKSLKRDPEPFPDNFFSMLMTAPPQAGKSILTANLIMKVYPKAFNKIFLVCPDDSYNSSWQDSELINSEIIDYYFNNCRPETIDEIEETIRKDWTEYEEKEQSLGRSGDDFAALIVFDDMATDLKASKAIESKISQLIRNRRQIHTCLIFAVQDVYCVPKGVRKNMNAIIIFSKCGNQEREDVNKNFIGMKPQDFRELCSVALRQPYDFLVFNRDAPESKRFARNFNFIVATEDK